MIKPSEELIRKGFTVLFGALILTYIVFFITRQDYFLSWSIRSSADTQDFVAASFQKGLFQFDLSGTYYTLEENFESSGVQKHPLSNWTFMLSWLGVAYLLACFTFFSRFWFIVTNGLFILFLLSLEVGGLGLFGLPLNTKLPLITLILAFVGTGYAFQAFFKQVTFGWRLLTFVLMLAATGTVIHLNIAHAALFFKATSLYGFSFLTFLFVVLVAEEIVFTILFVVTQAQGKGNQRHFILVGVVYLLFVTLYYLKKAGIYANTWAFLNPYFLLPFSAFIAIWSLRFKQEVFEESFGTQLDIRHLLVGLGLVGLSSLSTSFIDGNDPAYESFHYLITYVHLGLGAMFFIYIIVNFIDAMIAGHPVYRIVYRERNFPYATAKLGGIIMAAAFFFLASREPYRLIQGGRFNYLGDHAEQTDQAGLAHHYHEQGGIFAYNNHYSNFQLGLDAIKEDKISEAIYRFDRATTRYPTVQSYVNTAEYIRENNLPKAISILRTSKLDFGEIGEVNNNLANLLVTNNRYEEAQQLLEEAPETGDWNMAPEVNYWRLLSEMPDQSQEVTAETFNLANKAVKANMIAYQLAQQTPGTITFDTTEISERFNLHDIVLLNNAAYLTQNPIEPMHFQRAISATYNGIVQEHIKFAHLFNKYLDNNINGAYLLAREMEYSISALRRGELQDLIGLLLLEQGMLEEALAYFEKSSESSWEAGTFHAAVALTEKGRWSAAKKRWQQAIEADPGLQPYYDQMISVLEGKGKPDFNYYYYRWNEFTPEELVSGLQTLNIKTEFIDNLWGKIQRIVFAEGNDTRYQKYFTAFEPLLSPQMAPYARLGQAYFQQSIPNEVEVSRNAFDELGTIAYVEKVSRTDTLAAYNLVIEAHNIHKASVLYLKKYFELALALNLISYAEETLLEMEGMVSEEEFRQFKNQFETKRAELKAIF